MLFIQDELSSVTTKYEETEKQEDKHHRALKAGEETMMKMQREHLQQHTHQV